MRRSGWPLRRSLLWFPLLLAACPLDGATSLDMKQASPPDMSVASAPDLSAAPDLASGSATFGCDYRPLGPSTAYCQDMLISDETVRAQYQKACTDNKATLLTGACPHLKLGGCRSTRQLGPVTITTTNWFESYPGISTGDQLAALCARDGSTYVAP